MLSKLNSEIISFFPVHIQKLFLEVPREILENACEIRFRTSRPIIISRFSDDYLIRYQVSAQDIIRLIENFSNNSIYSIQNEINQGFMTIRGGHRIGISGTSVWEDNRIKNLKYISSINIRIAREVKNCSVKLIQTIAKDEFQNTLLISPPRIWKNYSFA